MGNYVETSNYMNSYGSINALDIWNDNRGYYETDVVSKNPDIGGIGNAFNANFRMNTSAGIPGVTQSMGISGMRGLGEIEDFLGGMSLSTIAIIGGFLYFMAKAPGNQRKKSNLRAAKDEYRKKVKKIKDDSGFLGWKLY